MITAPTTPVFVDVDAQLVVVGATPWPLPAFIAGRRAALADPRTRRRAIDELALLAAAGLDALERHAPHQLGSRGDGD